MDDLIRMAAIREAIRRGSLPTGRRTDIVAGPGSEAPCDGCGLTIPKNSTEYEFDFNGRTVRMHLRCFAAWADEVEKS